MTSTRMSPKWQFYTQAHKEVSLQGSGGEEMGGMDIGGSVAGISRSISKETEAWLRMQDVALTFLGLQEHSPG